MNISDLFQQVLNFINTVPADIWTSAIEIIVAALVTSPLVLGIKKWANVELAKHQEVIMLLITIAVSVGTTVVAYIIKTPEYSHYYQIAQAGLTFATTQPVYYLFIKPLYRKIAALVAVQVAKAMELNAQKTAATPAEGLPIGNK